MPASNEISQLRAKATVFELCALAFRLPTEQIVDALVSGEFAAALQESARDAGSEQGVTPEAIAESFGLLKSYETCPDKNALLHNLRVEYTGLFVGAPVAKASPYAGHWAAAEAGVEPLYVVNPRSADIRRAMASCGIAHVEGDNTPLDHIATICEFLSYLNLVLAGDVDSPAGADIGVATIEEFSAKYMHDWIGLFARQVIELSREPFYKAIALVVGALFSE